MEHPVPKVGKLFLLRLFDPQDQAHSEFHAQLKPVTRSLQDLCRALVGIARFLTRLTTTNCSDSSI